MAVLYWYSGGERSPLYNRLRANAGYTIFAANRYKFAHNDCWQPGTPGETRTHYLTLRRRTLYPGELRGHADYFAIVTEKMLTVN